MQNNIIAKLKNSIEVVGQLTRGNPSASMTKIKERENKTGKTRKIYFNLEMPCRECSYPTEGLF